MFDNYYTEIDIDECWRNYPFAYNGLLRVYVPYPYQCVRYVQLTSIKMRRGFRKLMVCERCNSRRQKLYASYNHKLQDMDLSCRECLKLKYVSQYSRKKTRLFYSTVFKMKHILNKQYDLGTSQNPSLHARRYERLVKKFERLQPLYEHEQKSKMHNM